METQVTGPRRLIIIADRAANKLKMEDSNGSKIFVQARQLMHGASNREEITSFICVM